MVNPLLKHCEVAREAHTCNILCSKSQKPLNHHTQKTQYRKMCNIYVVNRKMY